MRGAVGNIGLLFASSNAFIIAGYTIADGIVVRLSGNAASYTLWLLLLDAWRIFAYALWRRGHAVMVHLHRRWMFALTGSVLTLGS